jgi:hypothetical protein
MSDKNFRFLGNKMEQLSTALFVNYSMALQKFPVSMIRTVKMDKAGNMVFSLALPCEDMSGFDRQFPAHLHVYNKDRDYYIEAAGNASIIVEELEVLVSFHILRARSFHIRRRVVKKLLAGIYKLMDHLLMRGVPEDGWVFEGVNHVI